ncbi:MAG: gamma-glutamyl-gamma-aminobutyrate hydrolase family protein [Deltaproteobacteria bacterium]|nr:gamma-glutamyl-gamma-aminobutyrate hydrolase family protein [Deltaproteobacteria bacterium]
MKPIIGVTPDTHSGRKLKTRTPKEKIVYLWDQYLAALFDQGATPVILPVTTNKTQIRSMVERLDGVMLAGGNFDVPPELFGEKPKPWLGPLKPERSQFEIGLVLEAVRKNLPVLGICGGMQAINVAFGGTLYQDIGKERPKSRSHQQKLRADKTCHQVKVAGGTKLRAIVAGRRGKDDIRLRVNSTHHQAIRDVAPGYTVNAVATDGVIEGIEKEGTGFVLGVQWHPELLFKKHQPHSRILGAFVRAAKTT